MQPRLEHKRSADEAYTLRDEPARHGEHDRGVRQGVRLAHPVAGPLRQLELLAAGAEDRSRLSEGLRQVRASTGSGSVCNVVEVAPWSRIPETRALFVPRDD